MPLTAAHLVDWGGSGKAAALAALGGKDAGDAKAMLYECLKAATLEKLPAKQLVELLSEADCPTSLEDFASALSDAFWMLQLVCENQPDPTAAKAALASLVKEAVSNSWVTADTLKARCEPELLEAADVVLSAGEFNKRVVKVKTQLMFTQKKFNLLREESEGYSNVITELCQGKSGITVESAGAVFERIQALIGYFDLDPNRCFDLILEAYEQNISTPGYMALADLFNPSQECVCQIVGFKFSQCAESDAPTPKSLYRLAAMMVKKQLLRIEDVYPHLTPTDPEARENEEQRRKWMEKKAKSIGVVSLSDNPKDKKNDNPEPPELPNQKLGLLEGLMDEGDLESAEQLFRRISFMRPASHAKVQKGLCAHLREVIDPLYDQTPIALMLKRAKPNAKAARKEAKKQKEAEESAAASPTAAEAAAAAEAASASPWDVLESKAMPLLRYLGCHVGQDVILFTQICRTVFHLFSTEKKNKSSSTEQLDRVTAIVMEMIKTALMPGLTLITANPGVSAELWGILELLDYTARFEIYGDMKTDGLVKTPELVLAKAKTNDRAKKVTQRISNDTFKQQGRELGKLSHSNPIVVFERIIATVKMMPNIISALVDSLRYISPLAFDVLTYLLVEGLSDPERSRLKSDGQNLAEWLAALSEMAGSVCRRYQYIELAAVIKYVSMQMISGNPHDLVVLRKIVSTMTGTEAVEDLTDAQLIGQSGGPTLRNETNTTGASAQKATTKTARRLKDSLVDNKLGAPLIILTGQQCGSSIYNAEFRQIKLIGEVYDKVQETLMQLVTFLQEAMKKDEEKGGCDGAAAYASLLPSLQDLVQKHKIEPEAAFYILRSVLEQKCGDVSGVVGAVKEIMPASMWSLLSPELYATFWGLSLYDIEPPMKVYGEIISKTRDEATKVERDRSLREKEISKRLKEKNHTIEKLTSEKKTQSERKDVVHKRLKEECGGWILRAEPGQSTQQGDGLNMFVQACIFPRVMFSQLDAIYCAKFVLKMHEVKTPHFSVLLYYDKVIKLLAPALYCCSGNEARRLGRFLGETLKQLEHWKSEPSVYRRECMQFPGFKKTFNDEKSPPVAYIDFVRVNHKWHLRLLKMFTTGLKKDHTEIRNSLIMLRGCVEHFPVMKRHYKEVTKICEAMEKDDRQDLKMMALAYRAQLKKRESLMISDEAFRKEAEIKPKPKPKPKAAPPPKASPPPPAKESSSGGYDKKDDQDDDGGSQSKRKRGGQSGGGDDQPDGEGGHSGGRESGRDRDRDRDRDRGGESGSSKSKGGDSNSNKDGGRKSKADDTSTDKERKEKGKGKASPPAGAAADDMEKDSRRGDRGDRGGHGDGGNGNGNGKDEGDGTSRAKRPRGSNGNGNSNGGSDDPAEKSGGADKKRDRDRDRERGRDKKEKGDSKGKKELDTDDSSGGGDAKRARSGGDMPPPRGSDGGGRGGRGDRGDKAPERSSSKAGAGADDGGGRAPASSRLRKRGIEPADTKEKDAGGDAKGKEGGGGREPRGSGGRGGRGRGRGGDDGDQGGRGGGRGRGGRDSDGGGRRAGAGRR